MDALKAAALAIPFSMPQLAARLAADADRPVYDCFYLALAIRTGYPVVTADARLHDKLRAHPCPSDRILQVARAAPRRMAR